MLYEEDVKKISKTVLHSLQNNCTGHNGIIDTDRLLKAISIAVTEAIKQYDELKRQ